MWIENVVEKCDIIMADSYYLFLITEVSEAGQNVKEVYV